MLSEALPRAPAEWLDAVTAAMPDYGITTPLRQAHFLGQLAHESAEFTRLQENLNYQAPRILAVWPKRFATILEAQAYEHNPEKLANRVYANRLGNGDEESGDGWRYRGRGPIQITGRDNYAKARAAIKVDVERMPDLVIVPVHGSKVAGWFWQSHGCNELADRDDLEAITKIINGAQLGLEGRRAYVEKIKEVL